jgi:hypothetical protein
MSKENPTQDEVVGAAKRLYYLFANYAIDHPEVVSEEARQYWDPELWDVTERLGALLGVEVDP